MAPAKKKRAKRDIPSCDTKKLLVRTAETLISEHGFDGVTIDDITNACGLTKGAFYYSFDSKSDLVYEIERYKYKVLAHNLEASEETGLERLCTYVTEWLALHAEGNLNVTRQSLIQNLSPELRKDHYGQTDRSGFTDDVAYITSFLNEAVEDEDLIPSTPAEGLAQLIVCTLYGYISYCCMSDATPDEMADWGGHFLCHIRSSLLHPYYTAEALKEFEESGTYSLNH